MIKKTLATLLSSALILLSPGLASWSAAADVSRGAGAHLSAPLAAPAGREAMPGGLPSFSVSSVISAPAAAVPQVAVSQAAAAAAPTSGAAAVEQLLERRGEASLATDQISSMPEGALKDANDLTVDRLIGVRSHAGADGVAEAPRAAAASAGPSPLAAAAAGRAASFDKNGPVPAGPSGDGPGPRGSRAAELGGALLRAAAAGAAVIGLQAAGAALAPAVFGIVPVAAVWAVAAGIFFFPVGLYARYRLSLRDSPRLAKVKWLLDASLGAFVGAVAVAVPVVGLAVSGPVAAAALPLAAAAGAGAAVAMFAGARAYDIAFGGVALIGVPAILGVGAAGLIGIAPMIGLMALPAITTLAFFLRQIISAAETGRPFAVPGSLQKFRFPTYNWLMTGVVFALTTGFSAVYSNQAFLVWTLFGNAGFPSWDKSAPLKKNLIALATNFNVHYLGLVAWVAATGFSSPLTFLALAFAPERAAAWTEELLGKLLPKAQPAPSSRPELVKEPRSLSDAVERRWPNFHHWAKTFLLLGVMGGFWFGVGWYIVGLGSLLKTTAFTALLVGAQVWFAPQLIKAVMKAQPTDDKENPETYSIMAELREKINAARVKKGQKAIPMPEIVQVDGPPNAFATGRDPMHAMVGVTTGIKQMLVDPEGVREGLVRLLAEIDAQSDSYKVFRIAMAGGIAGVTLTTTPQDAAQAVRRADAAQLHAFGTRLLRGVLGHEFSHVMDRHMVTGSIGAAINAAVAMSSYGILWTIGHAKALFMRVFLGRPAERLPDGRVKLFEPITAGGVVKALPLIIKWFAAIWVPVTLSTVQMAGSRNNEGQADEDGALLTQDPAALALALGLLMTWRPPSQFQHLSPIELPRLAAVAHMMTVNPLEQMSGAGALPKTSALEEAFGRGDGFLQDMFLTHPETTQRIQRLLQMSEALGHDENPPGARQPPPAGGGGAQAPPLASVALPQNAPAESRGASFAARAGGLVRGAWDAVVLVLPDPARNREFWKATLANAIASVDQYFRYSALTKLLAPEPQYSQRVTDNRAVNSGAQLLASLFGGPSLDNVSTRGMLMWTHALRSPLMMLVPAAFFLSMSAAGAIPWLWGLTFVAFFHAVVFLNGVLQSLGMNAGQVGLARIVQGYESHYNKANIVFSLVVNLVGVVAPTVAGYFIVAVDGRFGALTGNALAFGVGGLLLAGAAAIYSRMNIPRDPVLEARRALAERLRGSVPGFRSVRADAVSDSAGARSTVLIVEVAGEPAAATGVPGEFAGMAVRVERRQGVWGRLVDGFRTIRGSRFLWVYLLFSTLTVAVSDPIIFAALPKYLTQFALTGAQQAQAFGWYLSASSLGAGATSVTMMLWPDRAGDEWRALARPGLDEALADTLAGYQQRWRSDAGFDPFARFAQDLVAAARRRAGPLSPELYDALTSWARRRGGKALREARAQALTGLSKLERQGRLTALLHAASWLLYFGVLFAPTVWMSVAFMGAALALAAPAGAVWSSLVQKALVRDAPQSMGKVFAAMFFYQMAFTVAGSLAVGWTMARLLPGPALAIAAALIVLLAAFDIWQAYANFRRPRAQ